MYQKHHSVSRTSASSTNNLSWTLLLTEKVGCTSEVTYNHTVINELYYYYYLPSVHIIPREFKN